MNKIRQTSIELFIFPLFLLMNLMIFVNRNHTQYVYFSLHDFYEYRTKLCYPVSLFIWIALFTPFYMGYLALITH
jgi:hypothetical protein